MMSKKMDRKPNHAILPVACHVFFVKNGEIFLMKRSNTGFQDGKWSVPAGRLNENETLIEGAIREAREEVDADVEEKNIQNFMMMSHKDERGERLYAFFLCNEWRNDLKNLEPAVCSEVRWFRVDALPQNMVPHVRFALGLILSGKCYAEFGYGQ